MNNCPSSNTRGTYFSISKWQYRNKQWQNNFKWNQTAYTLFLVELLSRGPSAQAQGVERLPETTMFIPVVSDAHSTASYRKVLLHWVDPRSRGCFSIRSPLPSRLRCKEPALLWETESVLESPGAGQWAGFEPWDATRRQPNSGLQPPVS